MFNLRPAGAEPGLALSGGTASGAPRLPTPLPAGAVSSHYGPQWSRPSPGTRSLYSFGWEPGEAGERGSAWAQIPQLRCFGV